MRPLSELSTLLPTDLAPFLRLSTQLGFTPVLVGGAVRDFFLGSSSIQDWDFELHHSDGNDSVWSKLQHQLQEFYQLSAQPHGVVKGKAHQQGSEFEFALPRVESFANKESYSHSDFTSKAVFKLDFARACQRRDFTINAMGAAFIAGEWQLWDPLKGKEAIEARELRPCFKEDFVKDPVRWVRAQRFAMKLGLSFSPELVEVLDSMDLEHLSAHYVAEEAVKARAPFDLWNRLQQSDTLPARFQGGLAHPQEMQDIYQQHLERLGFSNALLAAVFFKNEGWHLLLPLGGKGDKEVTLWRERRELSRQLQGKTPAEILLDPQSCQWLERLTKAPLQWMREGWVRQALQALDLEWIATKPWPEIDLQQVAPPERHRAKVQAWLKS